MSTLAIGAGSSYRDRIDNSGSSDTSEKLKVYVKAQLGELRDSHTWNSLTFLYPELQEILSECSSENWDGENGCAITAPTYTEAVRFLEELPVGMPIPEIIPESDGDIGFEWSNGKGRVFVASVSGDGCITYAGVFGRSKKAHGVETFDESIPQSVVENIRRIFR
ncbi:MAG TPA: hypothetical protein PKZ35_18145 [Gammaproteobacteria bacterium]|nr:hypothetical protein [Gammaproteobacteria bacterium]